MEFQNDSDLGGKKATVNVNLHLKDKKDLTAAERALLSAEENGTPAKVDDKHHLNQSGANNLEVKLDDKVAPEDRAAQKNKETYRDNEGTNTSIARDGSL